MAGAPPSLPLPAPTTTDPACPPISRCPAAPQESVRGMIGVLESGVELQGTWHDYAGKVIPW